MHFFDSSRCLKLYLLELLEAYCEGNLLGLLFMGPSSLESPQIKSSAFRSTDSKNSGNRCGSKPAWKRAAGDEFSETFPPLHTQESQVPSPVFCTKGLTLVHLNTNAAAT